jgi:hypothetical protein
MGAAPSVESLVSENHCRDKKKKQQPNFSKTCANVFKASNKTTTTKHKTNATK